jgi:aspartate aminotransferase
LNFKGEHVSVARFYPEGTIISSGLSKWCGAGGWRLGTFSFPPELKWIMDAMAAAASETYTSVSAPIQYAAIRAFKCGINIERYLWRVRKILQRLAEDSVKILQEGGVMVHMPDGAFYLFIDCTPFTARLHERGIMNSRDMCEQLLQDTGVAILPGAAFNRPANELSARIATVNFDGAKALAKCETIPLDQPLPENFSQTYCKQVLDGLKKMVKWLQQ